MQQRLFQQNKYLYKLSVMSPDLEVAVTRKVKDAALTLKAPSIVKEF